MSELSSNNHSNESSPQADDRLLHSAGTGEVQPATPDLQSNPLNTSVKGEALDCSGVDLRAHSVRRLHHSYDGFYHHFARAISAEQGEVCEHLQQSIETVFSDRELCQTLFIESLEYSPLRGRLTEEQFEKFLDLSLNMLLDSNAAAPQPRMYQAYDLTLDERLKTQIRRDAIRVQVDQLADRVVNALRRNLPTPTRDSAVKKAFESDPLMRRVPPKARQLLLRRNPERSSTRNEAKRIIRRYMRPLPDTSEAIVDQAAAVVEKVTTVFRRKMVEAVNENLLSKAEPQPISADLFNSESQREISGDRMVDDLLGATVRQAVGYRAEEVLASIINHYTREGADRQCMISPPYSAADRALHADLHFAGKTYDVKSTPHAFLKDIAERLGLLIDEEDSFRRVIRQSDINVVTSNGEIVPVEMILDGSTYADDPVVYLSLLQLLQQDVFAYGGDGTLKVLHAPQPITFAPQSPFRFKDLIQVQMGVTLDPLANPVGKERLDTIRTWAQQFIHNSMKPELRMMSRQLEAVLYYSEFYRSEGPALGVQALEVLYSYGAEYFRKRDYKILKNHENPQHVITHQWHTREGLAELFPAELVSLWEDLGVVTFARSGQRLIVQGLPGHASLTLPTLSHGLQSLLHDGQDGKLPPRLAEKFADLSKLCEVKGIRSLVNTHAKAMVGRLKSLISDERNCEKTCVKPNPGTTTRDDFVAVYGENCTGLFERLGILTFFPDGRRAEFFKYSEHSRDSNGL